MAGHSAAAERLVRVYERAKTDNSATRNASLVYDYGSKFVEGATGEVDSVPLVSGATKIVVHAMEERSKELKSQYDQAVTKQLLIEADREIDSQAIDPVTGHVNIDALKKDGSLDWMTSDEFYSNVSPENREAINYARGNWEIKSLASVAATVQISQRDIKDNGARLKNLGRVVQATESYVAKIDDIVEEENTHIAKLDSDSKDASEHLTKIMATQLPARQKLALAAQDVIVINAAERSALTNEVLAEDIQSESAIAVHAMHSVAKLVEPKLATTLDQMAQVAQLGATIYASYLTGNISGMALGTLDLIGTVSAFGSPQPSAETRLLLAVLKKLDQIEKKIDDYLQEEMAALANIHREIQSFREEVLKQLSQLQLEEWGSWKAVLETNSGKVQPCAEAAEAS